MALTKINKHKITSSPDRCGIHKKNNPIPDHLVHLGATNYPKQRRPNNEPQIEMETLWAKSPNHLAIPWTSGKYPFGFNITILCF